MVSEAAGAAGATAGVVVKKGGPQCVKVGVGNSGIRGVGLCFNNDVGGDDRGLRVVVLLSNNG